LEAGHRGQAIRAGKNITMSPNQVLYELLKIVLFHDVNNKMLLLIKVLKFLIINSDNKCTSWYPTLQKDEIYNKIRINMKSAACHADVQLL
jgi:hypothetical protein